MIKRYEHTQVGYLIIVPIAAAMIATGIILATSGINVIAVIVLVVLAVLLVLFPSLTVTIWQEELTVKFGPGAIRKQLKLNEIRSCKAIRIPWYYGWGIRLTPRGMLFRVSGLHAVHIKLTSGKEYIIGTDVPQELEGAINQFVSSRYKTLAYMNTSRSLFPSWTLTLNYSLTVNVSGCGQM